MDYPEYKADLQRIHESEVYGIALFATAARLTKDPARREKWLALKALEEATLVRYLAHMRETGQPVRHPRTWAMKGHLEGAALGVMPWRAAMKLLADGTAPFQERFQRLQAHAPASQQAFFGYVVAHEKAIEAFAQKERNHAPDSLKAVRALLAS